MKLVRFVLDRELDPTFVSVPLRGNGYETLALETYALSGLLSKNRRMSFSPVNKP